MDTHVISTPSPIWDLSRNSHSVHIALHPCATILCPTGTSGKDLCMTESLHGSQSRSCSLHSSCNSITIFKNMCLYTCVCPLNMAQTHTISCILNVVYVCCGFLLLDKNMHMVLCYLCACVDDVFNINPLSEFNSN